MFSLIAFSIIIIANAFYILGFHRACQFELGTVGAEFNHDGVMKDSRMILWWVGYWSYRTLGEFWSKPIYSCPTCMASVHGLLPFWITYMALNTFHPIAILYWIFYTLVLSGLATFINER